jgi:hypothetical protein
VTNDEPASPSDDRLANAAERSASALESMSKPDPYKRLGFWVALLVGGIALATFLVGPNVLGRDTDAPSSSTGPSSEAASGGAGAGQGQGSSPSDSQNALGSCVSSVGRPMACGDGQAGSPYQATTCDVASASAFLGVEPSLDSLDITVAPIASGECRVAPGPDAAAAGATATDLLAVGQGSSAINSLRQCARRDASTAVVCAKPHELEYVGGWTTGDAKDVARCEALARRYTNRTLAEDSSLRAVTLSRRGARGAEVRCAVSSYTTLTGSVRLIGGRTLPTT